MLIVPAIFVYDESVRVGFSGVRMGKSRLFLPLQIWVVLSAERHLAGLCHTFAIGERVSMDLGDLWHRDGKEGLSTAGILARNIQQIDRCGAA